MISKLSGVVIWCPRTSDSQPAPGHTGQSNVLATHPDQLAFGATLRFASQVESDAREVRGGAVLFPQGLSLIHI